MQALILNKIFKILLRENKFSAPVSRNILKIKNKMFKRFNPKSTSKNQRFDFSFSFKDRLTPGVRFSYNNYEEKEHFLSKSIDVIEIFSGKYNINKLRDILKVMQPGYLKHQTTLGIEWLVRNSYPRFKVYFEELRQNYPIKERLGKLKEIFQCVGVNPKKTRISPEEDIAAICIDLLADTSLEIKTYTFTKRLNNFLDGINLRSFPVLSKKLALFRGCLLKENRFFYYFTKRFSQDSKLLSAKIYKIYEVGQISDAGRSILEIEELFIKLGLLKEMWQIKLLSNLCKKNKLILYPVIAALDMQFPEESKIDLYYSFRDKA